MAPLTSSLWGKLCSLPPALMLNLRDVTQLLVSMATKEPT